MGRESHNVRFVAMNPRILRATYRRLERARQTLLGMREPPISRKVPLRDVEPRWGEYFVANKILRAGFEVLRIQSTKGTDILTNHGGVEVKTSRNTQRFKPDGKKGYGWSIKKKQWRDKRFKFLVCVLADEDPVRTLAFTRNEVVNRFSKGSFRRSDSREREEDSRILDFMKGGGIEDFLANKKKAARRRLKWKGRTSGFERQLNQNSELFFRRYTLERMFGKNEADSNY